MTKFKTYINEMVSWESEIQNVVDSIKKDCKPWLRESRNQPGFRATRSPYKEVNFMKRKTRTDRRPLSTNPVLHKISNKLFNKHFGWNARSNALFVMGSDNPPTFYGTNIWAIFPIGPIKYVWSQRNKDWLTALTSMSLKLTGETASSDIIKSDKEDKITQFTEYMDFKIKEEYQDSYLGSALNSYPYNEIMVKCKEYYMINKDFYIEWVKHEI